MSPQASLWVTFTKLMCYNAKESCVTLQNTINLSCLLPSAFVIYQNDPQSDISCRFINLLFYPTTYDQTIAWNRASGGVWQETYWRQSLTWSRQSLIGLDLQSTGPCVKSSIIARSVLSPQIRNLDIDVVSLPDCVETQLLCLC